MNVHVDMIDMETGEILGRRSANYAFNFGVKDDAGFSFLLSWIQSCVRGIRVAKKNDLQLRIHFTDEKQPQYLFGSSPDNLKEEASKILSDYVSKST